MTDKIERLPRAVLGRTGRCIVTGFTGVITGHNANITGCDQVCLLPRNGDKSKVADAYWVDINRVELLEFEKLELDTSEDKGACDIPSRC